MTVVVTVTLNPAIDQTILLDRLVPGEVHRARDVRRNAGGKGVNVASCLADAGVPVIATGILGQQNAATFEALFSAKGIGDRFVRVPGATRTNLKMVDEAGTTDVNLPGLEVQPDTLERVCAAIDALATPDALFVIAGSVPRGCPAGVPATLVARLAGHGIRTILDASGAALKTALCAPVLPYCIKPNRDELAEWAGRALPDMASVAAEARRLRAAGVALVIVSMGSDGALFCGDDGTLLASLPPITPISTVGAGDAMVAGIAAALIDGGDLATIARRATAFAAAKLGREGPNLPDAATVQTLTETVTIKMMTQGERL